MVICQTPFRVSFFGGGTDYPAWFEQHGGSVLSTAINKYGYISVRYLPPFFEFKHRIVYSRIELVNSTDEIQHPAVRAVFKHLNVEEGIEMHYDGDIPAKSGIGSSSSFTVGLLNALYALRGQIKSKQFLAEEAIQIEQRIIGETVGSQDQVAAAYGGFNRINFLPNGKFEVRPMIMPALRQEQMRGSLMLFFTGFSRVAETIAKSKIENFAQKQRQLFRMKAMVDDAQEILYSSGDPVADMGALLDEAWQLKRGLSSKVSTDAIDEVYRAGMSAGATGGKLLGAGGGGFILFMVPPEKQSAVRMVLRALIEVPIDFDHTGSQIILFNPNMTYLDRRKTKRTA